MSIHIPLTPEASAQLRAQQRQSSLSSLAITGLTLTLLGLLLYFYLFKPDPINGTSFLIYESSQADEVLTETPKPLVIRRSPEAAISQLSKVILSPARSAVSLPLMTMSSPAPSSDFTDANDFGQAWETGDSPNGSVKFFNQTIKGKRMAFVIDYSASMRGPRDELMRQELANSLDSLSHGMEYSLIFFAGPAWVAGDEFIPNKKGKGGIIKTPTGEIYEWGSRSKYGQYEAPRKRRKATWKSVNDDNLKNSRKIIRRDPLVPGTNWEWPLEMALAMEPAPDVINFMTDGATGNVDDVIKKIAKLAIKRGTKINCVALMEPRAKKGMQKLAKATGGQFTLVEK